MKKIGLILLLLGLMLTLAPSATLAQGDVACENEVVVQVSDFLSTIADKYYGNILAFPAIVDATNVQGGDFAQIDNADVIEPGWKLCIPSADDAQTMLGEALPAMAMQDEAMAEGEPIELRMIWWGSQNRHDRTIKAIEMYEAENPNVDIVYEFVGWGDYWTTTATQAAGGNLPDLMQHDYARLEEYVARDLLLPLDGFVESGTIDLSDVPAASIQGGRIGGTLYGINLGNNSFAVVIDADAFAKAGIEIPPQDWTWQDFENIALELHDKLGIWGAGPEMYSPNWWRAAYMGHGESIFAADGTRLGYTDDQPFIDLLSMVKRLQEAGAAPSQDEDVARFRDAGPENSPIVTGESAMAYYWSNQIVAIQSAAGEDRNLILHTLPRPEGGQSTNFLKPSMFWSITKHAKHPVEAAKFINWFTNSVEANNILLAERGVPIAAHVQQGLQPLLGKPQQVMFDFVSLVETDSSPIDPPDPAGWGDVNANVYLPEVIDPVLFGVITPEEGATILREQGDQILAAASQ